MPGIAHKAGQRAPREPAGHAPSNAGWLGSPQSPARLTHAQTPHGLTPAAATPLLASETLSSSLAYAASRSCAGPQCQSALRAKPSPGFPCHPSKPVLGIARKAEKRGPREPFGRLIPPVRERASGKEKCERHRRHFPRQPHPHFAPKVSLALGGRRFALGLTARPVSLRATARRYTLPAKRQNSAAPATRWNAPPQTRTRSVNGWHEAPANATLLVPGIHCEAGRLPCDTLIRHKSSYITCLPSPAPADAGPPALGTPPPPADPA